MPLSTLEDPEINVTGEISSPDDASTTEEAVENPPSYGENNERLPEQLRTALKDIVKDFQAQEQYDRRREVLRDRRNRYYERGFQHLLEQGSSGVYTLAVPGSMMTNSAGDSVQCASSMRTYNIFGRLSQVVASVLTQNPPGIDFQPDNPNNSEDVEAAEVGEGYRNYYDRMNDTKAIQAKIVRMLQMSGRTVVWNYSEENPQRDGYEKDGKTPRKVQRTKVYGTLESKVSILATGQDECCYVVLSDDPDIQMLKEWYPAFADKLKPGAAGIGENEYERVARLGIMQGTRGQAQIGDALGHVTTRQQCFVRPAAFKRPGTEKEQFNEAGPEDRNPDDSPLTVEDKLRQLFPEGCRVCFVGEEYVGSWAESMDDHLAIGFPYAGDGMHRKAMMDDAVTLQDDVNDDLNAYREVGDFGWPSRYRNAEEDDLDAVPDQVASPYAYRAHKARAQMALEDDFHQEPDPNIPPTLWQKTIYMATNFIEFVLAAPPSLQGIGSKNTDTASGQAQQHAQAMGQQGIPWMTVQWLWAKIYEQTAKCALRDNPDGGEIVVPNKTGTAATYQLAKLKGNFGVYPDQDSSFPESTAAQRTNLQTLLEMAFQAGLGPQFLSPDNVEEIKEKFGYAQLVIPEAEARNKQLAEIEELLSNDPIKPPIELVDSAVSQATQQHAMAVMQARETEQPEPPPLDTDGIKQAFIKANSKSTVPVDPLDFHQYEFEKCQDYLTSSAARRYQANGGDVDGLENLRLHAMEHVRMKQQADQLLAPVMPPPMIPPPAAPGGKPAGHPSTIPQGAVGSESL